MASDAAVKVAAAFVESEPPGVSRAGLAYAIANMLDAFAADVAAERDQARADAEAGADIFRDLICHAVPALRHPDGSYASVLQRAQAIIDDRDAARATLAEARAAFVVWDGNTTCELERDTALATLRRLLGGSVMGSDEATRAAAAAAANGLGTRYWNERTVTALNEFAIATAFDDRRAANEQLTLERDAERASRLANEAELQRADALLGEARALAGIGRPDINRDLSFMKVEDAVNHYACAMDSWFRALDERDAALALLEERRAQSADLARARGAWKEISSTVNGDEKWYAAQAVLRQILGGDNVD